MRPHSQPLLPPGVDSNDYIPNEHATTPEPYVQATPHTAYGTGPYKSGSYVSNDAIGMTTHVRPQGQPFSHIQQNTSVNIVASTLSVSASNINPVRTVVPAQPMNAGTSIAEAQQMRRLRVREFMNKNKVHKPVSSFSPNTLQPHNKSLSINISQASQLKIKSNTNSTFVTSPNPTPPLSANPPPSVLAPTSKQVRASLLPAVAQHKRPIVAYNQLASKQIIEAGGGVSVAKEALLQSYLEQWTPSDAVMQRMADVLEQTENIYANARKCRNLGIKRATRVGSYAQETILMANNAIDIVIEAADGEDLRQTTSKVANAMRGAKDGSDIAYLPLFSEVSQSDHSIVCYSKRHDVFLNLLVTGGTSSRSDDRVGPDMGATALCHQVWMEARRCAPLCDVVRILKAKVAMTIKKARIKRSSSVEKAHARALQSAGQWLWVILAYNALQNASQPYKYHKVIQKIFEDVAMGCLLPNSDRQATYQDPTSAVTIDDPVNPVVIAEHLSLRDCELVTIHFQDCLKLLCLDQWQSVFYVDEQIDLEYADKVALLIPAGFDFREQPLVYQSIKPA